jgi:hypothetical protein
MTSTQANSSTDTQGIARSGPPSHAINSAASKPPMLLHFLKETKKESYFTGLQDESVAGRGSGRPKL